MAKIDFDGTEAGVPPEFTLLQAGAEIPRFCFHERVSIAGNCRVPGRTERLAQAVASCAWRAAPTRRKW
jgi:NADH dehydrogenase/NADH:ubiquinone oxidoreductase subunit G